MLMDNKGASLRDRAAHEPSLSSQSRPSGEHPLRVELGYPAKELSPNTPVHHMKRARFKKAAKIEAGWATRIALQNNRSWEPSAAQIHVHLIVHPPSAWRTGDKDNFSARCKSHLDGIADALGINDRIFEAPTIEWADRCERGKLTVELS
jgi:crossover junction endodeoxyribonuclease RusA